MNYDIKNIVSESITFLDIFKILLEKKVFILFLTTLFGAISIIYSLSLSNYYQSSALVKVASSESSQNNSSLISQYSGIASLAGIDIGSSNNLNNADLVIEQIKSKDFTRHLIKTDSSLIQNIIAAKGFNFSDGNIIYDENLFKNNKWIRDNKSGNHTPTYIEANQKLLSDILKVSKNEKNGLIRISVEHYSPVFAESFLNFIIAEINSINKSRDQLSAKSSIEYLENIASKSQVASVQSAISSLIENQIKKLLLSDVKKFYTIEPIDSPFLPEIKAGPQRSLICIMITLLGFIFSCLASLFIFFRKN